MSNHRWFAFVGAFAIILGMSGLLLAIVVYAGRPQAPALELISFDYEPAAGCPGDLIEYTLQWQVNRQAVQEISPTTKRGHTGGDTIILGKMYETRVVNNVDIGPLTESDASFQLPDLPPGEYRRVLSVSSRSDDSKPIFVEWPYTIRDDCK